MDIEKDTIDIYNDPLDLLKVILNSSNLTRDSMVDAQIAKLEKAAADINPAERRMIWSTSSDNKGLAFALEVLEPHGPIKVGKYEPWTRIVCLSLYGRIYDSHE